MFILPALFHLILKKKELKLYHYIFDILILIFGVYVGVQQVWCTLGNHCLKLSSRTIDFTMGSHQWTLN